MIGEPQILFETVTTVCIGLLIGTEFAVSAFINPILRKLDNAAQASAIRLFAQKLGFVMPFWYAASLLLLIVNAILERHQPGFLLLTAACAIWIAVILLTILFLVPINNRMARLDPESFLAEQQQEHAKWNSLHQVRVAALAVAMCCFLLAVRM